MSSKTFQKAVYLREQAAILRSSVVSARETAKILQKSKSWVAKWSSSQDFSDKPRSGRATVLDRTAKKIIEKAKYKRGSFHQKNQQTIEEQRSAWICRNSMEIYVQQRTETFETKKTTTFDQQTAESPLGIRSQILLSYSR